MYLRRLTGSHSVIDPVLAMELNNRITLLYLSKHLGIIYKLAHISFIMTKMSRLECTNFTTGHPVDEDHSKLVEKHAEWYYEGIP